MATRAERKKLFQKRNHKSFQDDETLARIKALEDAGCTPEEISRYTNHRRFETAKERVKLSSAELQRSQILKNLKSDLPKVATKFW